MRTQTTARVAGSLFLTATAAGVLSAVLLGSLDTAPLAPVHCRPRAGHCDGQRSWC